jgi:hypothetical protein
MKEFIRIYEENRQDIEAFIITTLKNNGSILSQRPNKYKKFFQTFPSMELLYITDSHFRQSDHNIFRHQSTPFEEVQDRSYMETKVIKKSDEFSISPPYISSATGHTCITVMKREGDQYIFIDFRLSALLGRLGLVEINIKFNNFTQLFYKLVGFSLMFFAFFAIGYAIISYISTIFVDQHFSLDALFKPIVSLTLGLAIFDLAKTILEREVFFKNYTHEGEDANVLTKFLIAIIIALSIEALMVVFKIALNDYSQMLHALYLIIGVTLIILSLGLYQYLSKK